MKLKLKMPNRAAKMICKPNSAMKMKMKKFHNDYHY